MLINAAMLGLGVALARASLAADQIANGTLVCPLKLAAPTAYSYYLLGLPEVVDRPKIAMFRRLLVTEAAATEASVQAIGSPAAAAAAEVAALPVGHRCSCSPTPPVTAQYRQSVRPRVSPVHAEFTEQILIDIIFNNRSQDVIAALWLQPSGWAMSD